MAHRPWDSQCPIATTSCPWRVSTISSVLDGPAPITHLYHKPGVGSNLSCLQFYMRVAESLASGSYTHKRGRQDGPSSRQPDWGPGYTPSTATDPPCGDDLTARKRQHRALTPPHSGETASLHRWRGQARLGLPVSTLNLGMFSGPQLMTQREQGLQAALLPSPTPPSCPEHPCPPRKPQSPTSCHPAAHAVTSLLSHPIVSVSSGRPGKPPPQSRKPGALDFGVCGPL